MLSIRAVTYQDGFCFVTYMKEHEYTIMAKSFGRAIDLIKGENNV